MFRDCCPVVAVWLEQMAVGSKKILCAAGWLAVGSRDGWDGPGLGE